MNAVTVAQYPKIVSLYNNKETSCSSSTSFEETETIYFVVYKVLKRRGLTPEGR